MLFRITTPFSTAGFEARPDGAVVRFAPVLRKWVEGRTVVDVAALCRRKHWVLEEVEETR